MSISADCFTLYLADKVQNFDLCNSLYKAAVVLRANEFGQIGHPLSIRWCCSIVVHYFDQYDVQCYLELCVLLKTISCLAFNFINTSIALELKFMLY